VPLDTLEVRLVKPAPGFDDLSRMTWKSDPDAGADTTWAVLGGSLADLREDAGFLRATCRARPTEPAHEDLQAPGAAGLWFLVEARNACGESGHGDGSLGPRTFAHPCP
jgi:hypothetical protein